MGGNRCSDIPFGALYVTQALELILNAHKYRRQQGK